MSAVVALADPMTTVAGITIEKTETHIVCQFDQTRPVLSSAIGNGGFVLADNVLNLWVDGDKGIKTPPQQSLLDYCRTQGWSGISVGMMTAASMKSFRLVEWSEQGVQVAVAVTTGLANARAAGDPAEWRQITDQPTELGTINIIIMTSASLTDAAMVEMVMIATEAKAAVLRRLVIRSPVSEEIATGTGTDAIAVVGGFGPEVSACGKHTLFGELLAKAVMASIDSSIN